MQPMSTDLVTTNGAAIMERVIIAGDLSKLAPIERVSYYRATCESLGLNPLTKPFEYIQLNGKLTLYATRNCTDQLRKLHQVSLQVAARERLEDIYVVTARATLPDGRTDESIGAVSIAGLRGEALANALMKAETKAKRRATLSIVGLSFSDETEVETIPGAQPVAVSAAGDIEVPAPIAIITPASDKQRQFIASLGDKIGWNAEQLAAYAYEQGIHNLAVLSRDDASMLIEQMKALAEQPPRPTNGKKPPTPEGARARFFTKWGTRLEPEGNINWGDVRGALRLAADAPEPTTVGGWAEADRLMTAKFEA